MSPVIFGCVICGYQIDSLIKVTEPWLGEFRIGMVAKMFANPQHLLLKFTAVPMRLFLSQVWVAILTMTMAISLLRPTLPSDGMTMTMFLKQATGFQSCFNTQKMDAMALCFTMPVGVSYRSL